MNGHQSTMVVDGPVAKSQLDLFMVTCWVTLVIFIFVGGVLAYATLKFKARNEADEHAEPPEQGHGNPLIELSLIGASVLALVIIAVPTLKAIWYTYDVPVEEKANAYEVTATGYQWWFHFEYPNEQIKGAGPLIVANELVIPAGRPVRVNLRSTDVIHSFWIPKLAGKVDMIPNRGNFLWLKADTARLFLGPVRRVLRRFACRHALPRDRARAEGIQRLAQPADGARPHRRPRAGRPAEGAVRLLPHRMEAERKGLVR